MKKILAVVMATVLSFVLLAACAAPAVPTASPINETSKSAGVSASASSSAVTDQSLQKIKDKGVFILGFDDAFKPMGFKDEKGEYVGFDIDMAREFCKKLGVELKLQPINWDTKDMELNSGNIDAIWNGLSISEERKKSMSFGVPYMSNQQVMVVKADSNIKTLKDLAGKIVITQEKSAALDAIKASKEFAASLKQLVEISDYVKAFTELKAGTVDAVAIDEVYVRYQITADKENYKILDEGLQEEEYGVGFRKGDIALTEEWNKIYKQLKDEGIAQKISEKWFGSNKLL